MCLICMKCRIIILIIIIISLGEILLSSIANTSRMHGPECTHTPPFRFDASVAPKHDEVNALFRLAFMAGSWVIQINTCAGDPISPRFCVFFAYKKIARPN